MPAPVIGAHVAERGGDAGQRGGDVLNMRWDDYQRGAIYVVQEKTSEKIWVSCPKPLAKLLDSMPRVSEFIFTNSRGKQYGSSHELSVALRTLLRACGYNQPGDEETYSMHGLRKNAGVELAMAGCTVPEIMAVLGHKSPKMAIFYVQQVNKEKLAETAAAKWDAHIAAEAAQRAEAKQRNVAARRQQIRTIGGTPV
jgi:integrase